MATILCLETATTNCSVSISVDGKIIGVQEENSKKFSHSEKLHVFIEQVLRESQINKTQLDAIAVSKGPGSYTGLRIGVSAAKGLCFALDIPLVSIPTLEVLAQQVNEKRAVIIPLLDARRMEVYSAIFNSEKKQIRDTMAEILTPDSFSEFMKAGKTIFLGDGAEKFKALCPNLNVVFLDDRVPSSRDMAKLAEEKYKISDIENVAYFEPFYLKEFLLG